MTRVRSGPRRIITEPAAKYGITPTYGSCESDACDARARTSCPVCSGDYCLRHASHDHR